MAGVIVNGFGWEDKYHPIRGLGRHYCVHCRSVQDFFLNEVRKKIIIFFFIPTVTINTKYAVLCAHCGEGYYIDDHQRDLILYQDAGIEISFEGIKITGKITEQSSAKYVCPKCGKPCLESGTFCVYCGHKLK